jgi:hypothetical protein
VEYVMVPVPEELADKVLTLLSWKGRPPFVPVSGTGDDTQGPSDEAGHDTSPGGGPIARAFAGLDDACRSLLAATSMAALNHDPLTVPQAARGAGINEREVAGTIVEVNNMIFSEGGPRIAVYLEGVEGRETPDFSWDSRQVTMDEPIARELAELAGVVHQE